LYDPGESEGLRKFWRPRAWARAFIEAASLGGAAGAVGLAGAAVAVTLAAALLGGALSESKMPRTGAAPPADAESAGPEGPDAARRLPTVASINLCTDQLVLTLADDAQIRTVSWLAADPEESVVAGRARMFPLNHGTAEEVLRFDPDVVLAGTLTSDFTRALLERLGYEVIEIAPAESIDAIVADVERVAAAIGQHARGRALADTLRRRRAAFARAASRREVGAVVLRPGGFTVGRGTLGDELMVLAGLDNIAADRGLDRWGSLSVETLVRSEPELLILARYRADQPSLANTVFEHPAVEHLAARAASLVIPGAEWGCGLPQSLDSVAAMQAAAAATRREEEVARAMGGAFEPEGALGAFVP
jgi:iron complex transport system substrate-binding protein